MACLYGLMIFYCIDEGLKLSLWIAVIQLLMMITAGMIRRGTFPISSAYQISSLPGWLLAISLILIIPFAYANDYDSTRNYVQRNMDHKLIWPSSGLALELPEPIVDYGRIYTDHELEFQVEMYNVSKTRFNSYIQACKRRGFTDVNYEFDDSFSALNEEGYDLYCWLSDYGEMSVTLRSPKKLSYIDWPDNELLELLPEPDNLYGRVDADRSGYAAVCIGSIWDDEFKEYTNSCREAGFKKNYERKSDMYQANDEEGNLLLLDYNATMNVMYIQIWSAEEIEKYEDAASEDTDTEESRNKRGTEETDTEETGTDMDATEESDTAADE